MMWFGIDLTLRKRPQTMAFLVEWVDNIVGKEEINVANSTLCTIFSLRIATRAILYSIKLSREKKSKVIN